MYEISTALGLLTAAREAEARLPEEERAYRKERRRMDLEERRRRSAIIQNICPSCKAKLVRGKKNKKNDYKRDWHCTGCATIHSL